MWTPIYIISQILAFLAAASFAITFFVKKKTIILFLNCLNSFFFSVHYLLLGAYTGAVINIMSIIRSIWIFNDDASGHKQSLYTFFAMHIMFLAGMAITYHVWWDWIALLGGVIFNIMLWQPNYKVYRWMGVFVNLCYFTYDMLSRSIIAMVFDALIWVVEICGVINLYVKPKKLKDSQDSSGH